MPTPSHDGDSERDDATVDADASAGRRTASGAAIGPRVVGAIVFAVGLFLLYTAYDELGDDELVLNSPRFAPIVVSIMWTILSGAYLLRTLVRPGVDAPPEDVDDAPTDGRTARAEWRAPALLTGLLVAYAVALEPLGFVLSTTFFYFTATVILGGRKFAREAVTAVCLALIVYYGMTEGLDIRLPRGVLPL